MKPTLPCSALCSGQLLEGLTSFVCCVMTMMYLFRQCTGCGKRTYWTSAMYDVKMRWHYSWHQCYKCAAWKKYQDLLGMQTLPGCDTVSFLFGKGKLSTLRCSWRRRSPHKIRSTETFRHFSWLPMDRRRPLPWIRRDPASSRANTNHRHSKRCQLHSEHICNCWCGSQQTKIVYCNLYSHANHPHLKGIGNNKHIGITLGWL